MQMNASIFDRVARLGIFVGLGGIVLAFLYASAFGGNRFLPILYYLLLAFIVIGVVVRLIPRSIKLRVEMNGGRKLGALFCMGLLLCALPVPWLFAIFKLFGSPSGTNLIVAFVPAILSVLAGIFLLFWSYFAWEMALRRNAKKIDSAPH